MVPEEETTGLGKEREAPRAFLPLNVGLLTSVNLNFLFFREAILDSR